jgi:hypothetical protein
MDSEEKPLTDTEQKVTIALKIFHLQVLPLLQIQAMAVMAVETQDGSGGSGRVIIRYLKSAVGD